MGDRVKRHETNWWRVCRLLIECGRELLLHFFQDVVSPLSLRKFLIKEKCKIEQQKKKLRLSVKQLSLLYCEQKTTQQREDELELEFMKEKMDNWDITLISCLLNYFSENNTLTLTKEQCDSYNKIRELRNRLYAHRGKEGFTMTDSEFEQHWQHVVKVLQVLQESVPEVDIRNKIKSIQTETIVDDDQLKELYETFDNWMQSDREILDRLRQNEKKSDEQHASLTNTVKDGVTAVTEAVKESETTMTEAVKESETTVTKTVKESETTVTEVVKESETTMTKILKEHQQKLLQIQQQIQNKGAVATDRMLDGNHKGEERLSSQVSMDAEPDEDNDSFLRHQRRKRRSSPIFGNKNAEKTTRKIELGWQNKVSDEVYKPVRSINGGGTRNLTVEKKATVNDLLNVATETFFPDRNSKQGKLEDFICEMKDFKCDPLGLTKTVEELYKDANLKVLKVYLFTKPSHYEKQNEEMRANVSSQSQQNGIVNEDEPPSPLSMCSSPNENLIEEELPSSSSTHDVCQTPLSSSGSCSLLISPDPEVTSHQQHDNRLSKTHVTAPSSSSVCSRKERLDVAQKNLVDSSDDKDFQAPTEASFSETNMGLSTSSQQELHMAQKNLVGSSDDKDFQAPTEASLSETNTGLSTSSQQELDMTQINLVDSSEDKDFQAPTEASLSETNTGLSTSSQQELYMAQKNLVDSSDDKDFQAPTEASLSETNTGLSTSSQQEENTKSKEEILRQLQSRVDRLGKKNLVNVTRENVIEGAIRAFQRRNFNPCAGLHVTFGSEYSNDDGGLTREFMRLLKKEISQHPIFVGEEGCKTLAVHTPSFDKGFYKTAGQMLAYMMVHKGPTPDFLDPFMYKALCRGLHSVKAKVGNVQDVGIREHLQKIAIASANEFHEAVKPLELIVRESRNTSLLGKHDQRNQLVKALCQYLVIENVKPAYDQFSEGLRTLGLLSAIKEHSDTMKPFFVYHKKALTAEDIFRLYRVSPTSMTQDGSNRKRKEDATVSWWRDMVVGMEEEETLPKLLSFLTGLDEIPPLGFECEGSITFRHSEDLSTEDSTQEFPLINTRSLKLRLPILDTYDVFVQRFKSAMSV